jgi:hypothetical protein
MQDEHLSRVRELLTEHELRARRSAMRWRGGYRALLVSSALFSTGAAIIGKLTVYKFDGATDVASILAAAAAVITTLIAALDFEVNARINRRSRQEIRVIALEAEKSTANSDALLSQLQEVVMRRSEDLTKPD